VLGHDHGRLGHVEDLPGHAAHHLGVGQAPLAAPAPQRLVGDHHVGGRHLRQRRPRCPWLLALPAVNRRPSARRAARFAFSGRADLVLPESLDGGLEEVDEFRPSSFSSSAILPVSSVICSFSSATRARNAVFSTSNSAMRAAASTPTFYNHSREEWWMIARSALLGVTGYALINGTVTRRTVDAFHGRVLRSVLSAYHCDLPCAHSR
jgi:hypothetical protein